MREEGKGVLMFVLCVIAAVVGAMACLKVYHHGYFFLAGGALAASIVPALMDGYGNGGMGVVGGFLAVIVAPFAAVFMQYSVMFICWIVKIIFGIGIENFITLVILIPLVLIIMLFWIL